MTQHHYTVWIGDEGKDATLVEQVEGFGPVEGVTDITPFLEPQSVTFTLSNESLEAQKAFNAEFLYGMTVEPPTYDVIVDTDPEPKEPEPPEHIRGFWAWLTAKNEKAWNDYLDEFDAWVEEYVAWLNRQQNREVTSRLLFKNVRIEGGEDNG